MKFKWTLVLFALCLFPIFQVAKAADQAPVTLNEEIFNVSGPGKHKKGTPNPGVEGVERPFTLAKKSKITLTVGSNKQKPSLNVYVLDAENYSKYQNSGSLTNLNSIDSLTKTKTLGFQSSEELAPGKYVLILHWAENPFLATAPAVHLRLVSQEIAPKVQKPSITPTKSFWKKIF